MKSYTHVRKLLKNKRNDRQNIVELPLAQLEAVVFDLETTGFSPEQGDEIISIGATAIHGHKIQEDATFYSLINTNRTIEDSVVRLTSITNDMVKKAPELTHALAHFFEFVSNRTLIVHGSGHDKRFLNAALWKTTKTLLPHRIIDTMLVANKLHPHHTNYGLDEWLQFYNIVHNKNRHHALGDACMTAHLWIALVKEARYRNVKTVGDLYEFLSR